MVMANDFPGDKKSDPGPPGPSQTTQTTESRLQPPYTETDFDQSTIFVSSYDDSESSIGTLPGTVC